MITLGLTGSIGMGKSTTLRLFEEAGAAVWDADAAVHRLYEAGGEGARAVAALFGQAVLNEAGAVNRAALGPIVLGDEAAMTRLEAAIHPLVAEDRRRFLSNVEARGAKIAVVDVPLLLETGGDAAVDIVVLVTADETVRRERVLERPGMTPGKLDAILSRQMPEAERVARADHVIRTDQGVDAARAAVGRILESLTA